MNAPYNPAIRIDQLGKHTLQEVYDFVIDHLRKQSQPAKKGLRCCYRLEFPDSAKVLRCAVGCLIPDEIYKQEFEGRSISGLVKDGQTWTIPHEHFALLEALQRLHDRYFEIFKVEAQSICKNFNLTYSPPQ